MRIIETFNKGRPEVSKKTPLKSFKKACFTDSLKVKLSESTPSFTGVLLPTTSTCSSTSSAVIVAHSPGMGRLSPSLIKSLHRKTTGHPNQQQRMQFQYGLTPDSPTSLFFISLQFLNRDITGITGNSRSLAPAT